MGMALSIILGMLIFGYAGWMLVRFVQTSRKGKCAACALKKSCEQAHCQCTSQTAVPVREKDLSNR